MVGAKFIFVPEARGQFPPPDIFKQAGAVIVRRVVPRGHVSIIALSAFSRPLLPTKPRESTFHRPAPFSLGPIGPNVESRLRRPCKAGAQICRAAFAVSFAVFGFAVLSPSLIDSPP